MRTLSSLSALALIALAGSAAIADGGPEHRVRQSPPVKMGTSGGSAVDRSNFYCCGGTVGALVWRNGTLCILSNNHVLGRSGTANAGEDTIQPALIDTNCSPTAANVIGDYAGNLVPLGSANVDAAISIARTNIVDLTGAILDIGVPCSNIQAPALNMQVMKSGRTTGFTTGRITSLNTSVQIQYQRGCNTGKRFNVVFQNQIVTTDMSDGGDSGSLLVSNDGSPNPVGLLFAGSSTATIHNPIQHVVNAFSAGGNSFSFVGNNCANVVDPPVPGPTAQDLERALNVKVEHEADLMKRPDVYGVGIGCAENNFFEAVIVIFASKPAADTPAFPKQLDGINVRVIHTDPFVAH